MLKAKESRNVTPKLLLLPGLLCDGAVWEHQRGPLSALGECLIPDYGLCDSIEAMARQTLALAADGPLYAIGHSMGGRVALEIARLAPERLTALVLMDTGTEPLSPDAALAGQERAKRLALLDIARNQGMRAMGRQWARGMVHPDRLDTPLFAQILDMIERKTPEIFAAQINALLNRPDARGVFAGLKCPTLLMCGRDDAWSPLSRHEQMQAVLPGAELAVIEHSGHMSTMEQPETVTAALLHWFAAKEQA